MLNCKTTVVIRHESIDMLTDTTLICLLASVDI